MYIHTVHVYDVLTITLYLYYATYMYMYIIHVLNSLYLAGVLETLGSQALLPCNGVLDGSCDGVMYP